MSRFFRFDVYDVESNFNKPLSDGLVSPAASFRGIKDLVHFFSLRGSDTAALGGKASLYGCFCTTNLREGLLLTLTCAFRLPVMHRSTCCGRQQ